LKASGLPRFVITPPAFHFFIHTTKIDALKASGLPRFVITPPAFHFFIHTTKIDAVYFIRNTKIIAQSLREVGRDQRKEKSVSIGVVPAPPRSFIAVATAFAIATISGAASAANNPVVVR